MTSCSEMMQAIAPKLNRRRLGVLVAQFLLSICQAKRSLKPEFSNGLNVGFTAYPVGKMQVQVNVFRNDIKNLIEYAKVHRARAPSLPRVR